jgi:hypothetical protein
MNRLELFIYNRVKDRPELKLRIVRAYQFCAGLIPQQAVQSNAAIATRAGYFYGFHDKSPFSADNSLLLAHRNLSGDRPLRAGDEAEVGFFTGAGWLQWSPLHRTKAWDWQLGAMLQWRGNSSEQIAFNDIVDGAIGSRIFTTGGRQIAELPHPIVHVSPCGEWASSYCFRRVGKAMPGYGVRVAGDERGSLHDFTCADSADFRVFALASGATRFAFSLDEVRRIEPHPSMEGAFHYFHHSLFNPSGTRLFFLHRWVDRNSRRWTRMFSCDSSGNGLSLFPTHEMVSHIGWSSDTTVLAYARTREQGDGYYFFSVDSAAVERVAGGDFNSDGHPMLSPDRKMFVTDTYPDRFRNQYLFLYDLVHRAKIQLARTHLPRKFLDDLQVDLHPRFDRSGRTVCFDSGHPGTRSLCTLDIAGLVPG